jgi:hypothetical protein
VLAHGVATPWLFDGNANAATQRALQTSRHPEFLGTTAQFLALARNVPTNVQLSGFKFARDGATCSVFRIAGNFNRG